eukprot:TRINITY_DN26260_c0_g1_i1.p1 TRINITY_DN26260_c0_g1~~TRINITY_DN26260_c0_g1_i1.p1  ORF type:complete len:403 (-),score=67.71 TRINITY_DN26260_c0_g1_i1:66-1274(-)
MSKANDIEFWLEPVPGLSLPSECYATVHSSDGNVSSSLSPCSEKTPCQIGSAESGCGQVIVDVFQKVASITLSAIETGAVHEVCFGSPVIGSGDLIKALLRVVAAQTRISSNEILPSTPPEETSESREDLPLLHLAAAAHGDVSSEPEVESLRLPKPNESQTSSDSDSDSVSEVDVSKKFDKVWTRRASMLTPKDFFEMGQSPSMKAVLSSPMRRETVTRFVRPPISIPNCDVIIPNLYLGGITATADPQALVDQGFRAVCCCCRELEFPEADFCKDLEYFRVDVEDISREPIDLFFPEATEFIHSFISREEKVLVHCRAGVSRSGSTVIAYLMDYHGYTLHDAFFLAKSHRSIVTPNIGFMEKLGEYEADKFDREPTIEINKYINWYEQSERAAVPDLRPD